MNYLSKIQKKLGVYINNDTFDAVMTEFKKKGVNIEKIKSLDNLADYSTIFVDLSFPLELGYNVVNKINSDPQLSDINIFAIISKRTELEKITQIQNVRIDGYVSLTTSFNEILKKLELVLSPEGRPFKNFVAQKVKIKVDAEISHISESGCLISSKVLFKNNSAIQVESNLVDGIISEKDILYKVSQNLPSATRDFFTEVNFINLSNQSRTSLRKTILNWSLK
jgi:CheY-like chemotaxis protein